MVCMKLLGDNGIKSVMSRLKLAVDKNNINPKSSWIEFYANVGSDMSICVTNYDYCLDITIPVNCGKEFHATISAESFIPLISKLDCEEIKLDTNYNSMLVKTETSEYNFPLIKEIGKVISIDRIIFNSDLPTTATVSGKNLSRVAEINTKGLSDTLIKRDFQQFICMDNRGCLTFTDNIIINDFDINFNDGNKNIKILLNDCQAKLLKAFECCENVFISIGNDVSKINFMSYSDEVKLSLTMVMQEEDVTHRFPSEKLRKMADKVSDVHATVNYKKFKKALERLMIFDKKFDITVMNYSKLLFFEDHVELVSIKNKNKEMLNYDGFVGTTEHESIIRFADLLQQVKDIKSDTIDISYGDSRAIILNSGGIKIMIPEIQ